MATRSIHDTVRFKRIINIQTLTTTGSPTQVGSGDIDLQGFDSHMLTRSRIRIRPNFAAAMPTRPGRISSARCISHVIR